MDGTELEVWNAVSALNRCWTTGRPGDLREYFHEQIVAITPADRLPLFGRETCVSAWSEYVRSTRILSWEASGATVQIYGDTAVVTYQYAMLCERQGRQLRPAGRDLMVLIRKGERWLVVADQFSPYPEMESRQDE